MVCVRLNRGVRNKKVHPAAPQLWVFPMPVAESYLVSRPWGTALRLHNLPDLETYEGNWQPVREALQLPETTERSSRRTPGVKRKKPGKEAALTVGEAVIS